LLEDFVLQDIRTITANGVEQREGRKSDGGTELHLEDW